MNRKYNVNAFIYFMQINSNTYKNYLFFIFCIKKINTYGKCKMKQIILMGGHKLKCNSS